MAQPDYYEVLQVHQAAEPEVIQAAYRRLSLKYHPDVYHGADAQQRMAQLNAAYAVLGDATKRATYDTRRGGGRTATRTAAPSQAGPSLHASPGHLDLGNVPLGRGRTVTVRVNNGGQGRLSGLVVSHVPWLRVSPSEFNSNELDVSLLFRPDRAGRFDSPRAVEIISNGGRINIAVRATVAAEGSEAKAKPDANRPSPRPHIAGRPAMDVATPRSQGVHIPFSAWVVAGTVLTSAIFFMITPVLTALPIALGVGLLWNRAFVRPRSQPGTGTATRSALMRCAVCSASFLASSAAKCSRCGGSVCPSCGACPCRTSRGR